MTKQRRRVHRLLLAAIGVGLVVRFGVALRSQPFASDSFHYMLLAENLTSGEGFVSGGSQHPDLTRLPVYPALIAIVSVVLGNVEWASILTTTIGGALTVVPLVALVQAMFGRKALIPSIVLGSVSCVIIVSWAILPEAVYLPVSIGAVASLWSSVRRPSRRRSLLAGALAGVAAITRAEGVAWLLLAPAWSILDGGPARSGRPGRLTRMGYTVVAAGAIYTAYAGWISLRLGRWEPFPEIHYLRLMREVDDRFGLRYAPGPWMTWSDRARFLLTEDRSGYVLESSFASGVVPRSDPGFVVLEKASYRDDVPLSSSAGRRLAIVVMNLRRVLTVLRDTHLVPSVLLLLGFLGVVQDIRNRRGRRRLCFLAFAMGAALLPVFSHVESRFLFPAFALGLVPAAGGWGWLASRARRAWPTSKAPVVIVHALIALSVAAAGAWHLKPKTARLEEAAMRREAAAWAKEHLSSGPMLALEPGIPFWSGHAYRAIPMGGPDAVLAFARAQEAAALSFEDPNDLERLPHLEPFRSETPPPGFRLLYRLDRPGVGYVKFFAIEPAP